VDKFTAALMNGVSGRRALHNYIVIMLHRIISFIFLKISFILLPYYSAVCVFKSAEAENFFKKLLKIYLKALDKI